MEITHELLDTIRGPDGMWPDDPAVPKDLPPLAVTDDPAHVKERHTRRSPPCHCVGPMESKGL